MNTNFLPYFKSAYSHGGMMTKEMLEQLFSTLKNITGEGSVTVQSDFGRGIRIIGTDADAARDWMFGVNISGRDITIQAGRVDIVGASTASWEVAKVDAEEITASFTSEYCYPTMCKNLNLTDTPTLAYFSSYPQPVSGIAYYPLVRLVSTDSGVSYNFDGDGHVINRGVWQIPAPIALGQ